MMSNNTAEGTTGQGTGWAPKVKPTPRLDNSMVTLPAASRPNTDPPDSTTACTCSTRLAGSSTAVSRLPGAPPLISMAVTAGASGRMTVVPLSASQFSALPTLMPATSVMRLRGPAAMSLLLRVKGGPALATLAAAQFADPVGQRHHEGRAFWA